MSQKDNRTENVKMLLQNSCKVNSVTNAVKANGKTNGKTGETKW